MDLSLIICTYNRSHLLIKTLEAVIAQQTAPSLAWEIIVVDNNSRDDTHGVVDSFVPKSRVPLIYAFESRQGQSYARNTGVETARGDIVAFTDDDVLPEKRWIAKIVEAFQLHQADGVGGRILPEWEAPVPRWVEQNRHAWWCLALLDSEKTGFLAWPEIPGGAQIWGANMAFKRSVFQDIGGFDTGLGNKGKRLYRGEETELIHRARENGKRFLYDANLVVYHRVDASRMTKKYFRRVAFDAGHNRAELSGLEPSAVFYGAPSWLYRVVSVGTWKWLVAALTGKKEAFGQQVDLLIDIGYLWQFWKLRFAQRREQSSTPPRRQPTRNCAKGRQIPK